MFQNGLAAPLCKRPRDPGSPDWTRMSISRLVGRAAEQQASAGGLLNGSDPTEYNTHDPIRLFIIQLGVIMLMTQGNHTGSDGYGPYSWVYGTHFPEPSRPFLALVANIGLVLFLFLVGLEIDVAVIKRNAKTSLTISTGGMILPFGLGAAVAIPVYNNFIDPEAASFGHFLLFVGVAFSITAFPVLCRILVALELLDTTVGIVVLSAGVGNDVVGWTLLALTVALVNASTGLTALYVLLVESGPSPLFMTVTILLVFGSAFFTDIIGVHAIFGGFLRVWRFPTREDMVSIIFLPLYFTLSGLSTNLGLLDNGALAARFAGFTTREAATIGTLMSCKGLVELIVLNVGLSAGILSTRVFSMFVLEALVLTFATTPVTLWLYPLKYRVRATAIGGNFGHARKKKFLFVFDRFESLPGAMMLSRLLQVQSAAPVAEVQDTKVEIPGSPGSSNIPELPAEEPLSPRGVTIDALRLLELTERTSAIMRSSEIDQLLTRDPLLTVFRTFAELEDIPVASSLSVVSHEGFATSVTEHSVKNGDEMVVVSWTPGTSQTTAHGQSTTGVNETAASSGIHSHFLRGLFVKSSVDVALFIDRGPGGQSLGGTGGVQHLFLPFFGGPDDRLALSFVAQLCKHPLVSATVVRVRKTEPEDADIAIPEAAHVANAGQAEAVAAAMKANNMTIHSTAGGFPDTVYAAADTQTRLASDTLDDIIWTRCNNELGSSNVAFKTISTPTPLRSIVSLVHTLGSKRRLISIVGRGKRLAVESHKDEMKEFGASGEMGKTAGDVAAALFVSDIKGPIVVLQAAYASRRDEHE
ncbi:Sodium/hydrogen exchanger family [Rhizoctonia solani]|uniref:Sodium/hydrogen exchanger family n=1 Tax=Rhizoctonia solani TaxID=456999 RepID=A0A8H8NZ46_9AGAM|nr:Sodium/hydrogen exchanger family [Rhizoctonia solani]QRW20976.1 Sodium/hydrogen exchanger family [Rhizoctonia solani]